MFGLLLKLVAILETLIAIVIPLASPIPVSTPSPSPVVEVLGSTPVIEPTPVLTPTPQVSDTPTPSPLPITDVQELISQIRELKEEIISYTPEPTPQIIYIVSTPTPTPRPTINYFKSDKYEAYSEDVITLSWDATGADKCGIVYRMFDLSKPIQGLYWSPHSEYSESFRASDYFLLCVNENGFATMASLSINTLIRPTPEPTPVNYPPYHP